MKALVEGGQIIETREGDDVAHKAKPDSSTPASEQTQATGLPIRRARRARKARAGYQPTPKPARAISKAAKRSRAPRWLREAASGGKRRALDQLPGWESGRVAGLKCENPPAVMDCRTGWKVYFVTETNLRQAENAQ